eukprot:scaffold76610_cov42-Phaeocystis_antarctica.AAC.5
MHRVAGWVLRAGTGMMQELLQANAGVWLPALLPSELRRLALTPTLALALALALTCVAPQRAPPSSCTASSSAGPPPAPPPAFAPAQGCLRASSASAFRLAASARSSASCLARRSVAAFSAASRS